MKIETVEQLRTIYKEPKGLPAEKKIHHLDQYCQKFIELSPFAVISTSDGKGGSDLSPKGDPAGFVKILDENTLLLPDRRGNNRLDNYQSLLERPAIAMLFFIPGINETLRVYGDAEIRDDEEYLAMCREPNNKVFTATIIRVHTAFFHCGRALFRSDLWGDTYRSDRDVLPSLNEMVISQIDEKKSRQSAEAPAHS